MRRPRGRPCATAWMVRGADSRDDEVARANGISGDLYSLTESATWPVLQQTDEVQADLKAALEARDRRDFDRALELVRNRSSCIDPAVLS